MLCDSAITFQLLSKSAVRLAQNSERIPSWDERRAATAGAVSTLAARRRGAAGSAARAHRELRDRLDLAACQRRRTSAPALHARPARRAMSELRFNELRGEEVVYAIHRQDRTFLPSREHCPLDPTRPGGPQTEVPFPAFEIAVFDNRFPAFEAPLGAAEVVVYTDRHDGSFATLAPDRAEALMWVWRHRYQELGAREDVEYVMIFENRGVEVGVTLHHPHGQIYGYPFVPPIAERERAADERLGECATCALLQSELDDGRRVLCEDESVVAHIPYAARWAFE